MFVVVELRCGCYVAVREYCCKGYVARGVLLRRSVVVCRVFLRCKIVVKGLWLRRGESLRGSVVVSRVLLRGKVVVRVVFEMIVFEMEGVLW